MVPIRSVTPFLVLSDTGLDLQIHALACAHKYRLKKKTPKKHKTQKTKQKNPRKQKPQNQLSYNSHSSNKVKQKNTL